MPTPVTHLWRPSSARLIVLDGFAPVPRGATQTVPVLLAWPAKDPSDLLDYQLDVTEALAGDEADAITTLDVQITPDAQGDLTMTASGAEGCRAVLWLSGGQIGTTYTVMLTLGTGGGRTISRAVQLPVLALATSVASDGLLTDSGVPLTDENGNPLTLG
jgi:hypothetical protein